MKSKNISKTKKLNQIKPKIGFSNIKSNFIMRKIINNLNKIKLLEIIRYNQKFQKFFNITINDYNYYSKLYSSVEVELKVVDNKYDEFINILKLFKILLYICKKNWKIRLGIKMDIKVYLLKKKNIIIFILIIQKKKLKEII